MSQGLYKVARFNSEIGKFATAMLSRVSDTEPDYLEWERQDWSYDQMITELSRALYRVESEIGRGIFADKREIRCRLADCANALMKAFKKFEK
jgi:hypothetical protein